MQSTHNYEYILEIKLHKCLIKLGNNINKSSCTGEIGAARGWDLHQRTVFS